MDVTAIKSERIGITVGMVILKLPSRLKPEGDLHWHPGSRDERNFHEFIASKINQCQGVTPGSTRVTASEIRLMPTEGAEWEDSFSKIKEVLAKY